MKKVIVLLVVLSIIPTIAFAGAEIFIEDMESYSDSIQPVTVTIEDNTSKQLGSTDWWFMNGKSGNPLNAGSPAGSPILYPTLSVIKSGDNTVLGMTGGSGDYSNYIERRQAARYMGTGLSHMPDAYKIDFDYEKIQTRSGICFQFMIHNDGKNYYAVYISGEKSGGAPLMTVAKIVNNTLDTENIVHSSAFCKSPTASGGGSMTGKGHVSVMSDGEGVITVSIDGKRYSYGEYTETVTLTDSTPFDIFACETTVGFFVGVTQTQSCIDNIVVSDAEKYIDYEPGTVLYKNVSDNSPVNEFEESNVRRISSPSLANEKIDVVFKSESGDTTYSAQFNENGEWVNLVHQMPCTGITLPDGFDYSELIILVETSESESFTLAIKKSDIPCFPRIKGVLNSNDFVWTSSDESIVSVVSGKITGVRAGTATVTAWYKGGSLSYDVTVKGEYDYAKEAGRLDEYFAEKKPVFDEINAAISEKDAPRLKNVITNTGDIKLEIVLDINLEILEGKSEEEIDEIVKNLINYDGFSFTGLEDYSLFENTVLLEADVIKLEKVADASEIENILDNKNELLKLDVENKYFKRFKQNCISNLLNMEYGNYSALNTYFNENTVMTSFSEMISYADVEELINDSAEVINYDSKHYNSEKCADMFKSLLKEKSSIKSLSGLKSFINKYEKEAEPEKSSSGSSSGKRGSSSFSADSSYVKKAEDDANAGVSKENTVIYHDVEKDSWYEQYVLKLAGRNIMNGNDGYIKPGDNITRAEFIKILLLSANIPLSEEDVCIFNDVDANSWYYKYAAGGCANSIVFGSNNMFRPDSYITREEIAVLIDRVINNLGLNVKSVSRNSLYGDDNKISDWSYSAVARCSSYGIINGYGDNTFVPRGYATRAECAKMLSLLIDIIEVAETVK